MLVLVGQVLAKKIYLVVFWKWLKIQLFELRWGGHSTSWAQSRKRSVRVIWYLFGMAPQVMLYKANLQDRAIVAIWSVKLSWSSITTPRFLAVLKGVLVDEPSYIEKLWWSDGLAETASSSVLARFFQLEMSLRQAAMWAATGGSSGWKEK